ncbi:MAG: hypothetical protein IJO21_07490 [Oscillospiraceae bacterium]|nr:hypothetical protein [Oscillospiraceae bacterium]MBQ7130861.1 hypothetical protein [Oscillospiraceae bacterium]
MKYEHIFYRTEYDNLEIEFLLLEISKTEGWRAYILSDIDYKRVSKARSTDWHFTHLFYEADDKRYISKDKSYPFVCWTEPIRDLKTLKTVAAIWSELTAYYIRNGSTFAENQKKLAALDIL